MKHFFVCVLVLVAMGGIAAAGVWQTATADIDGDGMAESVLLVVGAPGEANIPYAYFPPAFIDAFGVPRTHMGICALDEAVFENGVRVLDSGTPVMIGDGLVYQNALYQNKQTVSGNGAVLTKWTNGEYRLERSVAMDNCRAVVTYRYFHNDELKGKSGLAVIWNQGRTTADSAIAFIDRRWCQCRTELAGSFAQAGDPNGAALKLTFMFDDMMQARSGDCITAWDDCGSPISQAAWNLGLLAQPDSLTISGCGACGETAHVSWLFRQEQPGAVLAQVCITPRTINVNASGVFTAHITVPLPHAASDIAPQSVACAGAHAQQWSVSGQQMTAHFNRSDIRNLPDGRQPLTVTGDFTGGGSFLGADTVTITHQGRAMINLALSMNITPNPFTRTTSFTFENTSETQGAMTLSIYNLAGQRIRTITSNGQASVATWDARDEQGRQVRTGIYVYRANFGTQQLYGRLVYLR